MKAETKHFAATSKAQGAKVKVKRFHFKALGAKVASVNFRAPQGEGQRLKQSILMAETKHFEANLRVHGAKVKRV